MKEEAKIEGDIPEFTTRALFGEYLNDRTMKQIELLNATVHYETIEDMQWLSETKQWELVTDSNEVRQYDRVHLCSGSLPVLDPYNLNGKPNYISNPYPLNDLTHAFSNDDRIVVIGTCLTAIDVLKYLLQEREIESVYAFSRHNFFHTVGTANYSDLKMTHITMDNVKATMDSNEKILYFDALDKLIQKEFDHLNIRFEDFCNIALQTGTAGLRESLNHSDLMAKTERIGVSTTRILNFLWQYTPESERKAYLDKYQEPFNLAKGKLPMKSAEAIIEGEDRGQLTILKDVETVEYDADTGEYIMKNEDNEEILRADWVINATGVNLHLEGDLSGHPLIHSLLNKRYIMPDTSGGLSLNVSTQCVISPSWGEFPTFHAHGMLVSGAVYLNNSTYNIQSVSHQLVKDIIANY